MAFDRFAFPEIAGTARSHEGAPGDRTSELLRLPESERALLLHLGRYLERKEANALLAQLNREERGVMFFACSLGGGFKAGASRPRATRKPSRS